MKTIKEIAMEAIDQYPGWAVKIGYLIELGKKYNTEPMAIHKEMVRIEENSHYCHACGQEE